MNLQQLLQRKDRIEAAIDDAIGLGESYSLAGSHSVRPQALQALNKQLAITKRAIMRYRGYSDRVSPNHGGMSTTLTDETAELIE